jgi:hypothetical protein
MKKLIVFSLMGMFLYSAGLTAGHFSTLTKTDPSVVSAPPAGVWVKLTLIFHRPKTDCKTGFGICVDFSWGIDGGLGGNEQACPVRMMINSQNQLILEVTESDLTKYENAGTLPYFKNKTSITLEDPVSLTPAMCKKLGTDYPVNIKAGSYPVTFKDNIYTVVFQL